MGAYPRCEGIESMAITIIPPAGPGDGIGFG
jgi:hypothetical protein